MSNDNNNSDCLTVLCFRVTALTQENTQLKENQMKLAGALKKAGDDAKAHNARTIELVTMIEPMLALDPAKDSTVVAKFTQLKDHLK